ncbi:hypothetical protein [Gallaecimonas sp. GXIMD4217]|uniref:hypothetical protein n=1 Tax=Gallaecimonas sp. GXIMD4217 TaxID=3131927 RepID=UPI00311ADB10
MSQPIAGRLRADAEQAALRNHLNGFGCHPAVFYDCFYQSLTLKLGNKTNAEIIPA